MLERLRGWRKRSSMEAITVEGLLTGDSYTVLVPARVSDPVVDALRLGQHLSPHLADAIARFSSPGGRVADFGAHVGSVALDAAAAERQVLAVDAAREFVKLIRASAKLNGFRGLTAEWAAVGDRDGTARFAQNGPFGQVVRFDGEGVDVPLRRGTTLLAERGWERIDLLKLDVEGSEPEAFAGLEPLLARDDGPVIVYESNGPVLQARGSHVRAVRAQVEALGYALFRFEDRGFAPVGTDEPQPESFIDLLALKPAHIARIADRRRESLSDDELAARALVRSRCGVPVERLYLLGVLVAPGGAWRNHPGAREALRNLAADPDPHVAAAATAAIG